MVKHRITNKYDDDVPAYQEGISSVVSKVLRRQIKLYQGLEPVKLNCACPCHVATCRRASVRVSSRLLSRLSRRSARRGPAARTWMAVARDLCRWAASVGIVEISARQPPSSDISSTLRRAPPRVSSATNMDDALVSRTFLPRTSPRTISLPTYDISRRLLKRKFETGTNPYF